MSYPKHEDHRGFFQELSRQSEKEGFIDIKQISWFTINPGKMRGGHYHKKSNEKFILLEGECTVRLQSAISDDRYVDTFFLKNPGDSFFVDTFMIHTFTSEKGCKILVLSNKEFDPNDTDTYT